MGDDPYRAEPAKSARSACKVCKEKIEKDQLRFGTFMDMGSAGSYAWRCLDCVTSKQISNMMEKIGSIEAVGGWNELSELQQKEVRKALEAKSGAAKEAPKAKAKAKAPDKKGPKAKAKDSAAPKGREAPAKPAKPMPSEKEQHGFLDFAKNFDFDDVKRLVEENEQYINVQPAGRWSALHQAAEAADEDVIKWLMAHGADKEVKTKDGKTPHDIAKKQNIKELLLEEAKVAKRKAPVTDGGSAKKAKTGVAFLLYLFKSCSATELSGEMGEWLDDDGKDLCKPDVMHKHVKDAPATARKLAERLQRTLGETRLPAGESDCAGRIVVISQGPDKGPHKVMDMGDIKEACLQALALKEEVESNCEKDLFEQANCKDKDYSKQKQFCAEEDEDDEETKEGQEYKNIVATTKFMADNLKSCFEFNFEETIVSAPVIYGGLTDENNIVGVLSHRVWT